MEREGGIVEIVEREGRGLDPREERGAGQEKDCRTPRNWKELQSSFKGTCLPWLSLSCCIQTDSVPLGHGRACPQSSTCTVKSLDSGPLAYVDTSLSQVLQVSEVGLFGQLLKTPTLFFISRSHRKTCGEPCVGCRPDGQYRRCTQYSCPILGIECRLSEANKDQTAPGILHRHHLPDTRGHQNYISTTDLSCP